MEAYLRLMGGLCIGRKRSASSCQRSALSYRLPFTLQSIFIKESSVVSDRQSALNRFTRPIGKLISERKPSAVSSQLSDMARHVRAISKLKPKAYQLSATGSQPSDTSRWLPDKSKLIPKVYHLIPLLILVFVSCGAVLAQEPVGHTAPAAQADAGITPLKIGDKVPDIVIKNLINYPEKDVRISDFKGKLLILDFWSTYCGTCIASFPEMEALQKEFGDKIQILLVNTSETVDQINSRFETFNKRGNNVSLPNLPASNGKSDLRKLFPYKSVPHHVWIDEQGVVRAITNGYNTTVHNVNEFLQNRSIDLAVKLELKDFDISAPLWLEGNGRHFQHIKYYSYFTEYINGISGQTRVSTDSISGKPYRVQIVNRPLLDLYRVAYGELPDHRLDNMFWFDNRIILEVDDINRWQWPIDDSKMDNWLQNNSFGYELLIPKTNSKGIFETMRQDLERFFGYQAKIERRPVLCWNLVKIKGGGDFNDNLIDKGKIFSIQDQTVNQLLAYLRFRYRHLPEPLIDSTQFEGMISINIDTAINDLDELRETLQQQGFDIRKEIKEINMLVITESKLKT